MLVIKWAVVILGCVGLVLGYPQLFETKKFRVGIEYDLTQSHNGNTLIIDGTLNGKACSFTVDTGASRTIVRPELLKRTISWEKRPPACQLRTATGQPVTVLGYTDALLRIGDQLYQHSVLVADITDVCILGLDFLKNNGCIVDIAKGVVRFKDQDVFLQGSQPYSLPMNGGADRYRHRNNYEPFFVTITTEAKNGYVITYLDVTATIDAPGEVAFTVVRGQTGSKRMVFQLVSNHTDFLSYSYLTYGMKEQEYKKVANIITLPVSNDGQRRQFNCLNVFIILLYPIIYALII